MADLWRDFWTRETRTGQQVAQLHDRQTDDDDNDDEMEVGGKCHALATLRPGNRHQGQYEQMQKISPQQDSMPGLSGPQQRLYQLHYPSPLFGTRA